MASRKIRRVRFRLGRLASRPARYFSTSRSAGPTALPSSPFDPAHWRNVEGNVAQSVDPAPALPATGEGKPVESESVLDAETKIGAGWRIFDGLPAERCRCIGQGEFPSLLREQGIGLDCVSLDLPGSVRRVNGSWESGHSPSGELQAPKRIRAVSAPTTCRHDVPVTVELCAFRTRIARALLGRRRNQFRSGVPVPTRCAADRAIRAWDSHRRAART